ncbi:MAG: hypothetical protein LBI43_06005 [Streptococcaceae bacterium]|nr:hypothetical protein [Streptococcaceae bacterium]
MADENEELKSPSSVESNETFEEKIARIQAILDGQKNEVAGRKEGATPEVAPELTAEALAARTPSETPASSAPENAEVSETEADPAVEASPESSEAVFDSVTPAEIAPVPSEAPLAATNPQEAPETPTASNGVPETPADQKSAEAAPVPANSEKTPARSDKKQQEMGSTGPSRPSRIVPVVLAIIALILIAAGVFTLLNNHGDTIKATPASSSSVTSSVSSSEVTHSTTIVSASSAASSASLSARQKLINSVSSDVGAGVALDPNYNGSGSWPLGWSPQDAISALQSAGISVGANPKFIPANATVMNIYQENGTFVASVFQNGNIQPK